MYDALSEQKVSSHLFPLYLGFLAAQKAEKVPQNVRNISKRFFLSKNKSKNWTRSKNEHTKRERALTFIVRESIIQRWQKCGCKWIAHVNWMSARSTRHKSRALCCFAAAVAFLFIVRLLVVFSSWWIFFLVFRWVYYMDKRSTWLLFK